MYQMETFAGTNSAVQHRRVLSLRKLDKKKSFSRSLSWLNRLKNLVTRDSSSADSSSDSGIKDDLTKVGTEERCNTVPRSTRLEKNNTLNVIRLLNI
ncbi:hypothetical protein KUTeg_020329 [Tegillarca granosa]|uniref:Uncharacterized protein n=1 Tax=Tegillarca granosa TaxID=220873 RepID=A0ABQ9E7Q8_TEGGR|nr:hypothetical protein KUTeg_020329 [Tegillarca granosa]